MTLPPEPLVRSLLDGPSVVTGFEWHDEIDSTNRRAAELAAAGAEEVVVVAADVQTAGRGRHGRSWEAPAGTSLMLSLLLRPAVDTDALPLLPLLAGLCLVEAAGPHCPGVDLALKWPNDLLANDRKAAGILAEAVPGAVVVGMGTNVDWRGQDLPDGATSLAHEAGQDVDRWRLLAALAGVFSNRYRDWVAQPTAFLPDYRARCATLGRHVRVTLADGGAVEGKADLDDAGRLLVAGRKLSVGDITHARDVGAETRK
jgi:BirA family transcriptional regulator, biotin operon repressor / biotin---[acetyl-CoA-carboxylase] ligase